MIFLNISKFLVQIISEGGAPGGHNPPGRARTRRCALVGCGPHVGPLTYPFTPHHHLPQEKIHLCSLSSVLALKPADFDLFARSSVSEFRGIVAWYVTPPFVELVFVLVVYILNN